MKQLNSKYTLIFGTGRPIIGMVHLRALPGSPGYNKEKGMAWIIDHALDEASRLIKGGIDAIQIENQFDKPFLKSDDIGWETVCSMTSVISRLQTAFDIPMGVNVHINGVCQALAIAQATNCQWIRAFELANAYISNSGYIEAAGPQALRYRSRIKAEDIMIFGDFHVKHGSHQITADRSLEEQAEDIETSLGDALIITGLKTGTPPCREDIKRIRKVVNIPLIIGSGLSMENLQQLLPSSDGAVVGSYFKKDNCLSSTVDIDKVKSLMDEVRKLRDD